MRAGSLCSGYGGLDLAVEQVFGAEMAWYAELDPAPAQVMAAHWDAPNLGDITALDWGAVEPVDVLTAGYPCQPFSHAGKRQGAEDDRHLWPHIVDAVRVLRPRWVVLENVAGHLTLGFDSVLADLAAVGFDAEWCVVRASDVGACHRRARLFVVAADTGAERRDGRTHLVGDGWNQAERGEAGCDAGDGGASQAAADANRAGARRKPSSSTTTGSGEPTDASRRTRADVRSAINGRATPADSNDGADDWERPRPAPRRRGQDDSDADRRGRCERGERDRWPTGGVETPRGDDPDGLVTTTPDSDLKGLEGREPAAGRDVPAGSGAWGDYWPAIDRHARTLGRPTPRPTDPRGRLNPRFVEWMMMLPDGWVTDVLTTRTKALKVLGNGVVPPQAAYALTHLLERHEREAAA